MSRRVALSIATGLLLVVAGVGGLAWRARDRAAAPVPVDPALAPYLPLRPGDQRPLLISWNAGPSATIVREVTGWEQVQGAPHARVEWWMPRRRHEREVHLIEWLRPGTTEAGAPSVVCSQRQVGPHLLVLDPPQPILVAPVAPGTAWIWSGLVGDAPARAAFHIAAPTGDGAWPDALSVVEQTQLVPSASTAPVDSAAPPLTATRTRRFVPGQGLVAETGDFPAQQDEGGGRMRLETHRPLDPAGP